MLAKVVQKYGNVDFFDPGSWPHIENDSDFAPLKSLEDIILVDNIFALSGLPVPILKASGALDVLATIRNPKDRQRLPGSLLEKNKAPKPMPSIRTIGEFRARWKIRGLPDPGEDFFKDVEKRFQGS